MNMVLPKNSTSMEDVDVVLTKRGKFVRITKGKNQIQVSVGEIPQLIDSLNNALEALCPAAQSDSSAEQSGPKYRDSVKKQLKSFVCRANDQDSVQRAQGKYDAALASLEKAIDYYKRMNAEMDTYKKQIRPLAQLFGKVMPDLACFAGCLGPKEYETLSNTLVNHRSHIQSFMSGKAPEDLRLPPDFPDITEPVLQEPAPLEGLYDGSSLAVRVNSALTAGQSISLKDLSLLLGECEESTWSGADTQCSAQEITEKTEALDVERSHYINDARKTAAYLRQQEKDWDYIRLLVRAGPVLWKIIQGPPEEEGESCFQWHKELGRQLWEILPCSLEQRAVDFHWFMPDSPEVKASARIQGDFQTAEADWPGLYCTLRRDPDAAPICVIPGGVFEA